MTTPDDHLDRCPAPNGAVRLCAPARWAFLALGGVCTALGIAGVILPGLPGTIFLLIALWAFSRSSERLALWLFNHPRFGRTVRAWHAERAIPRPAKIAALSMMTASFAGLLWLAGGLSLGPAAAGLSMALIGGWIATRPEGSERPENGDAAA
ncbi:MAG: YbaN family protein [Nitratireductor sp.]